MRMGGPRRNHTRDKEVRRLVHWPQSKQSVLQASQCLGLGIAGKLGSFLILQGLMILPINYCKYALRYIP